VFSSLSFRRRPVAPWAALVVAFVSVRPVVAEGDWEITPESERALERGLSWLARNQGPEGNWQSNDLGLVSLGALAFLSAGHLPGRGRYGATVDRALEYVVRSAKPSGLLNISHAQRDLYNHGLSAFVLGQAYGMTADERIGPVLDRSLKLIASTQCEDGGWDYRARRQSKGHDLSLAVMQAKALRSAVDSGFEVSPEVIKLALGSVRRHYRSKSGRRGVEDERRAMLEPGQFTYDGRRGTLAMAAAGVVCVQEFGGYGDWRIARNMEVLHAAILTEKVPNSRRGKLPCRDAYTLYYVGQAVYQVGGRHWRECYPRLRDYLVASQTHDNDDPRQDGHWRDDKRVHGLPGQLFGTAVASFVLAIPNRYLPILQEGEIDSVRTQFQER